MYGFWVVMLPGVCCGMGGFVFVCGCLGEVVNFPICCFVGLSLDFVIVVVFRDEVGCSMAADFVGLM